MYQGTTPTYILTLEGDVDLEQASEVAVTFKAGKLLTTKTGDDLEISGNEIRVFLTQEETLTFTSQVLLQVNWTYIEGEKRLRASSNIETLSVDANLLPVVL